MLFSPPHNIIHTLQYNEIGTEYGIFQFLLLKSTMTTQKTLFRARAQNANTQPSLFAVRLTWTYENAKILLITIQVQKADSAKTFTRA